MSPYVVFGISGKYFQFYSELQITGTIEDISEIIFILNENICCDPSLEPSRRDGSNDRSQHVF